MITSFETEAYYKACEVNEIDQHILFLQQMLDFVYSLKIGVTDTDKNIVCITAKISKLKGKKNRLKAKIKKLRA